MEYRERYWGTSNLSSPLPLKHVCWITKKSFWPWTNLKSSTECYWVKVRTGGRLFPLFFSIYMKQNESRGIAVRGEWIFLPPAVWNMSTVENNYLQKVIWIWPQTLAVWWDMDSRCGMRTSFHVVSHISACGKLSLYVKGNLCAISNTKNWILLIRFPLIDGRWGILRW